MSDEKKHIADLVGDDYKGWLDDWVIFDAATGSGKTTFCIDVLGKYARENGAKMLYVCNRSALRKQVYKRVSDMGLIETVTVATYQSLDAMLVRGETIKHYRYIVLDEAHYFTNDALFNEYTDRFYEYVKSTVIWTVIFMSATAKHFFAHLISTGAVKEENVYSVSKDYGYVDKIVFYKKKQLTALIDDILDNDEDVKIIVFCNSGDRIIQLKEVYDEANFYCSESTKKKELKKICDRSCIHDGTFEGRILFSTTALDNGIDVTDRRVKHVFSELSDADKLIQSLGRRRINDNEDTVSFYIAEYGNRELQGFINNTRPRIAIAEELLEDPYGFEKRHGNDTKIAANPILNFLSSKNYGEYGMRGRLVVNKMMLAKCRMDIQMYERMIEVGHRAYVLEAMGLDPKDERVCTADVKAAEKDALMEYLRTIEDKRIYITSEEMDLLQEHFGKVASFRYRRSINGYNGVLSDLYPDYPYRLRNKNERGKYLTDKRRTLDNGEVNPNRDRRYWIFST